MSVNTVKSAHGNVVNAVKQNPQFLQEALDVYKAIKGDIRDYIHGPLDIREYKNRMVGYGKLIGQWRNFLATIQVSSQIKGLDDFIQDMPKLGKD